MKQRRVETINRSVQREPQTIVTRRIRQHLDLIYYSAYAVNILHATFRVRLRRRPDHLSLQDHSPVVLHLISQPVKDAVIRDRKSTRLNSSHVSESRMPPPAGK